jgi:hypothetical protein
MDIDIRLDGKVRQTKGKQMTKKWHIYYLPKAVRTYRNELTGDVVTVYGKIGYSYRDDGRRIEENKWLGLDVSGVEIIYTDIPTSLEASRLEQAFQKAYDCEEPKKHWYLESYGKKKRAARLRSERYHQSLNNLDSEE